MRNNDDFFAKPSPSHYFYSRTTKLVLVCHFLLCFRSFSFSVVEPLKFTVVVAHRLLCPWFITVCVASTHVLCCNHYSNLANTLATPNAFVATLSLSFTLVTVLVITVLCFYNVITSIVVIL